MMGMKRTEETHLLYMVCNMFLISAGYEHFFFLYVLYLSTRRCVKSPSFVPYVVYQE
jgi:hypothetical protein